MANLDQIADYTADAFTVTEDTNAVTRSTGTLDGASVKQYGKVVTINITCHSTSATAQGANIFTGVLDEKYRPTAAQTFGFGFNGERSIGFLIGASGNIVIRNCGSSLPANAEARVSATYILS